MVSSLSSAIQICRDWEDTAGKRYLWFTFMCLINKLKTNCNLTSAYSFMDYDLMHLHVKSGICIYTVREYHVCVNLAIPRKNGLIVQILSDIADFVSDTYPGHTIDMRSLKTHVCELHGCCIQYRRVVPSLSHIQDMQLSEDRMWIHILGKKTKVHSLVKSRQQLYDLLPITRFSVDDDEETLYWFRFECGSVVLFKNPSLEEDVPPIPFVCITDQDMILKHTAPGLVCVVVSLAV